MQPRYRVISLIELVGKESFEDVSFLLMYLGPSTSANSAREV